MKPRRMTPVLLDERDKLVMIGIRRGFSFSEVAQIFNISKSLVQQIVIRKNKEGGDGNGS